MLFNKTKQMTALLKVKQLQLFSALDEAQNYHDTQRHGFFAILQSQHAKASKLQRSYKLAEMPQVLDLLDKSRDSWMSQAEFFKPNRRVVNLWRVGLLFVDLDTYTIDALHDKSVTNLVNILLFFCQEEGIPAPSLVISSGRGLQVKWLLEGTCPRAALPRWNACQRYLVNKLSPLGSDQQAKDASRVLRLVQTANSKNGEVCQVVHVTEENSEPIRYSFEYLCEMLLPFSREQLAQKRAERQTVYEQRKQAANELKVLKGGRTSHLKGFSGMQLAWHRLDDLRRLAALRGGYKEGERMLHLFWQLNFLLLSGATNQNLMWHEAAALARAIDNKWGYRTDELSTLYQKAKQYEAGEKIEFNGKKYPALYTPRNSTLINQFGITDDEQRKLRTIISTDIAKERHAERDTVRRRKAGAIERAEYLSKAANRQKQAIKLRTQGLSLRAIALELGVSLRTVSNYLAV